MRDCKIQEIDIDWSTNMINSIVGQILNNDEAKKNYMYILAMSMLSINDALNMEARLNEENNKMA